MLYLVYGPYNATAGAEWNSRMLYLSSTAILSVLVAGWPLTDHALPPADSYFMSPLLTLLPRQQGERLGAASCRP